MNKIYLYFLLLTTQLSFAQEIVNNVSSSAGEELTYTQGTINQTTGELVAETVSNSEITLTQGFQQTNRIFYLEPKVLLQGAMKNSPDALMRDDLRQKGYVPYTSPYNEKVSITNNTLTTTGPNAIVDWVTVELRNNENNTVIYKSALVQRDGDIVSTDGISPIQVTVNNTNYYVVVNHRNHLGVMTKNKIALNTANTIDFTNINNTPIYGSNLAEVKLNDNRYALWSGDANNNNIISYSGSNNDANAIKSYVLADDDNIFKTITFISNGYSNEDVNLDGFTIHTGTNSDQNQVKSTILNHPSNIFMSSTFSIKTFVPEETN